MVDTGALIIQNVTASDLGNPPLPRVGTPFGKYWICH